MKVAVFGAGVAGLTAAHELVERGFEVDVYERLPIPGGKARSVVVQQPGSEGLPGEHGFRFFPGFYRHVIDTMARIPFGNGHVVDNLVDATMGFFAHPGGPPLKAPSIGPTSIATLVEHLRDVAGFRAVLSDDDIEYFCGKLWQIMTSCDDRRLAEYEMVSWAQFIDADARSKEYQMWFAGAMTRTLIAASGQKASARTVGDILVTLMLDGMRWGSHSDRLLDGPTNEVWVGPWVEYLTSKGVRLHLGHHLDALHLDTARGTIGSATVSSDGGSTAVVADQFVLAVPVEVATRYFDEAICAVAPSLAGAKSLGDDVEWMTGMQLYLREDVPIVHGHVAFVGTPWGLTAISQNQFWKHSVERDGDHEVKGVLSIDISDWNTKGGNGESARECTPDEIRDEVIAQILACLPELPPDSLGPGNVHSFFIDPDIVFFDGDGKPVENHEPLYINEMGTHDVRPRAYTEIPNLYLASDYVRTNTDLATMEGANEAARRAVNALLLRTGSSAPRCTIWSLHQPRPLAPFRWLDERRFRRGEPWSAHFPRWLHWLAAAAHRIERKASR